MSNSKPIRPDLWELTLPALTAAWRAGLEYSDSGKYLPRYSQPRYRENSSGWPGTVVTDFEQDSATSRINWKDVFGPRDGRFTYVATEDVPELVAALDGVEQFTRENAEFAERLTIGPYRPDDEQDSKVLRSTYLGHIIAGMIARADALGLSPDDEDGLLDIYLQLERARLADTLEGDLVVPITLTDFGEAAARGLHLCDGVRIEPLPEDLQCARAKNFRNASPASSYLVAAATHAIVVEGLSIPNPGLTRRVLLVNNEEPFIPQAAMDHVERLIQCIHIVTSMDTGYNQVLVRPDDWADRWRGDLPPIWSVETVDAFPAEGNAVWNRPRTPMSAKHVAEIVNAFGKLRSAPQHVHLSARRAARAMMRTNDEDRTLDATIGIEALVLDTDKNELRFRLALRAAAALSEDWRPDAIFKLAQNVYDHRSAIAHGAVPGKKNQSPGTFKFEDATFRSADIAPFLLRNLLRSYLLSSNPWTRDDLDQRVLDALAAQGKSFRDLGTKDGESESATEDSD